MRILGIESSCDETAVALVRGEGDRVLIEKNLVASQAALHAKYGGVVPEVAAREHVDVILPLLLEFVVAHAGSGGDVGAVAAGPGLVPALRIGVGLAKTLAWAWQKPLVAVNHLEGHLYSSFRPLIFPALALLVSGGHTELVFMRGHGEYARIGGTRDDAAGEAFDKGAKLLGLGYPGGPAVSKMAQQGNLSAVDFPRPMLESGDFDFSFSGLKTAVAVRRAAHPGDLVEDVCASFQAAAIDTLVAKTLRAVDAYQPKSVILAGGVAANYSLRETLAGQLATRDPQPEFFVPELAFTGDNAAMIAAAGYYRARRKDF